MSQLPHSKLTAVVQRFGSYLRDGFTTFTFSVLAQQASEGFVEGEEYIVSIPGAEALNRRTLAALSLVGRGDIIHIEFAGVLTDGEYLEVHQLHSVTDISQDLP
jgi:hypothetical protein